MIDDRGFAKLWVEDRILYRPLARDAIARELRDKGVEDSIVQSALAELYPSSKERELAWRLARERRERLGRLDEETRERRVLGYLTRRGFAFDLSREIVRRLDKGEIDE